MIIAFINNISDVLFLKITVNTCLIPDFNCDDIQSLEILNLQQFLSFN